MASPFQGDDQDDFAAARDKEGNVKQTGLAPSAKLSSFGAAFNAARRSGDKTFTWKGKKYTTEMAKAKPKAAAPKATPKVDTRAEDEMTDTERRAETAKKAMNEYASQEGRFGSFKKGGKVMNEGKVMKKEGRGMAKADMQKVAGKAVKRHEKTMHGMKKGGMACGTKKYAKGGSIDGCATKGKTKGRMV